MGNTLMTVLPMLGGMGMAAFMVLGQNNTRGWMTGGMMVVMIVSMVGAQVWRSRSQKSTKTRSQRREYLRYLATMRERARTAAAQQRTAMLWQHPDPASLPVLAEERTRVWERSADDRDFLVIRYGVGPQRLALELVPPESETIDRLDPVAASALHRFLATHRVQPDLPSSVLLSAFSRVEVTGPEAEVRAAARAMLLQAAVGHSPEDLCIAVACSPAALAEWDWVKWLPHAHSARASDAAGPERLVATSLADLVDLLPADLADRPRFGPTSGVRPTPHVLLVVDGGDVPPGNPIVTEDGVLGVTILDLPESWDELTDESRLRLHLETVAGSSRVRCSAVRARREAIVGYADQCSVTTAVATARRLTPLYVGHGPVVSDSGKVSNEITDLLGLGDVRSFDPSRGWRPRPPRDRLRVPIGITPEGAPVYLDIKESAQQGMGPHGLVIGATGSGKSELLRTLVLALAMTHSSEILNLVLVDFKGGATFAGMAEMPHVSAVITNLEGELTLVDRMQDALAGEMVRRQELLRAAGNFASLKDYEKARAAGAPLKPLSSLLIVCDEFSELLSAKPEFVDLFVAIGRLGRSLGIHLLLASQRLEEGRLRGLDSHLSYRIGLRTFSAAESRAVIGVPDAYELPPVPGLGYLKPDVNTMIRFTASYVSGPPPVRAGLDGDDSYGTARREILPWRLAHVDSRVEAELAALRAQAEEAAAQAPKESRSLFDIAVSMMEGKGPEAHRVWLPPLDVPDTFDQLMPDLSADPELGLVSRAWRSRGLLRFPVGIVDMPREQRRDVLVADLSGARGHVAVVGGPRSGKSTLLRSIVTGLALTCTPREIQVYVLDFGGGTFTGLSALPHVAGVATRTEPDVVARVLAEVVGIVAQREAYFLAQGIDTIETYRSRRAQGLVDDGYGDVFLVVDGWGTLRSDFEGADLELQTLAQRALTYGVHLLTSATRWNDYRTAIRDVLGTRYELRLGDPLDSEVDRKLAGNVPADRPGRGLIVLAGSKYHFLSALPRVDGVGDAASLGSGVDHLVAQVQGAWSQPAGPKLRLLPSVLPLADLQKQLAPGESRVVLGINERDLAPVGIDVSREPHLLVYGDGESGKSSVLRTYMREIQRIATPETAQFFVVDYRRAHLGQLTNDWMSAYLSNSEVASQAMREVEGALRRRLPGSDVTAEQLRSRSWWSGPDVYVVVDDYELVSTSSGNPLQPLVPLLAQATDIGLHVVLARRSGGAGRSFDPVITAMKDLSMPGLILSGDPGEGALLGSVRAAPAAPGRARMVTRAEGVQVVQVAYDEPHRG